MCGIAGIAGTVSSADLQHVPRVMERLWHRGSDDGGYLHYSPENLEVGQECSKVAHQTEQ
jgi:asparagine synthetase B (glutamine-hydrolysing)